MCVYIKGASVEEQNLTYGSIRAKRTLIGFFIGVRSTVSSQMVGTREESTAKIAAERLFACMPSNMSENALCFISTFYIDVLNFVVVQHIRLFQRLALDMVN